MRLITRGRRAPLHTNTAFDDLAELGSPRQRAIDWLAGKMIEGRAGVDSEDETVFIVHADHQPVWARACIELCGLHIGQDGNTFRCFLEADVRAALNLDTLDAQRMEPLPGPLFAQPFPTLHSVPADLRDATVEEIRDEPTIVLQAMVDGDFLELTETTVALARVELAARTAADEPASIEARRQARAAYDRAYPEGA